MTDFEAKPAGFTAVNGKAPSPPHRSIHNDYRPGATTVDDVNRNTAETNGAGHSRNNSGSRPEHHAPSRPDDRLAHASTAQAHRAPSPPKAGTPVEATDSDRSPPAKKRTYPEAFEESTAQAYAARPPPSHRELIEHRSPERGYEAPQQALQDRERAEFDSHTSAQAGSPYSNDASNDETERRLAAALKGDGVGHDPVRDAYDNQDDDQQAPNSAYASQGDYGTPTRTAAGVAMNADRKRKRVFSNRTKTGCLTCRKRKKKCDELHPECNNCIRGGFVCEGYSSRTNWPRPTPQAKQAPVPLQSKITGGTYGGTPNRAPHTPYAESPQDYARGPELRPDDRAREVPMGGVASRDTGPPPYPPRLDSRFVNQIAPRYDAEGRPHDAHPEPGLHDPGMYPSHPAPPAPAPAPTAPAPAYQAHQAPMHPAPASRPPPTAPMHQTAPAVAQAVLEHVPTLPPARTSTLAVNTSPTQNPSVRRVGEPSERDKMLQGEYYLPYTPALMMDRDQCAAALYRFNQACQNPALGHSYHDRERFFRDIVSLRPTPDQPVSGSPNTNGTGEESNARPDGVIPQGSVGPGCVVEAPFHCDYGYNLIIGADVIIGANCRITDTCNVSIGNGVVLSPGVTLMCATYAIDPKERRRGKGRALGRGIVIEDEAWIGTNVTILPGVRVGRHSTVGAGSLIHKDVPPYTVMAGNPPKVVRGIGGTDEPRNI